ncbi:phytoene synthase, partial [Methylobacterium frigidaeris]
RRARVPGARKARLLARAILTPSNRRADRPALPEAAFLVEAVATMPLTPAVTRLAWWNLGAQVVRVLDLIETLRERERLGGAASS